MVALEFERLDLESLGQCVRRLIFHVDVLDLECFALHSLSNEVGADIQVLCPKVVASVVVALWLCGSVLLKSGRVCEHCTRPKLEAMYSSSAELRATAL